MTSNKDMPIMKLTLNEGKSIEFSREGDALLVVIEDYGAYIDSPAYFSLTEGELAKLVPKLTTLLAQLEEKGDE